MYAGHLACCPLVSHVEYAARIIKVREKDRADRQTDGRTPDRYVTLTARRGHLQGVSLPVGGSTQTASRVIQ